MDADAALADATIRSGAVEVRARLRPLELTLFAHGHRRVRPIGFWVADGTHHDRFVEVSEGVLTEERVGEVQRLGAAEPLALTSTSLLLAAELAGSERAARATVRVELPRPGVVDVTVAAAPVPLRIGARWEGRPDERLTGLGCRHGPAIDQSGRRIQLGADRRYTAPDCPPEMLELGGVPQGDYAPVPWLVSSRGWSLWVDSLGNGVRFDLDELCRVSVRGRSGPLRLRFYLQPTPLGRLRSFLGDTGFAPVLPEWAYGHWKSRDFHEHQDDVLEDLGGYRWHGLPLDAIVLDSPWETHYNSWEWNPHQFPDPEGMVRTLRATGVRTVVWTVPWTNLEATDGQRAPDAASERWSRERAPNYDEGAAAGHFVQNDDGSPYVGRWWMGTGSPVDFTSEAAEAWWRAQAERVLRMGVTGIKADDGEGYFIPDDVRFADGRSGAELAWGYGTLYRRSMQRALDNVWPGDGVLFGRPAWHGQQALGMLWGGDQICDFWSLRALLAAALTGAASGISNWSHDVGGYLGARLVDRAPKELFCRWAELGCFTPLMQVHSRFAQEPWTYDPETLGIFRTWSVLHERLVPYIRAAAATAARTGLPITRPLCLVDPEDPRGWTVSDAFGFGPALWVAPVVEEGATEREVPLPRGRWIDPYTSERVRGGGTVWADGPLDRVPFWVREGSIVVSHPAEHVATGLGDTPERERPLEATLWGEPALGRTAVRLADGTRIAWSRRERWSVTPDREITVRELVAR